METNNVEAEMELKKDNSRRELLGELESMRPRPYSFLVGVVSIFLISWAVEYFFGEFTVTLPVLLLLVYIIVKSESDNVHKRIDALIKITIKNENV